MSSGMPSLGSSSVSTTTEPPELIVERLFAAPRTLVWRALTEPERLQRWWGPTGWTLPVCQVDLRPGGTWLYCMRGPGGEEGWGRAVYREIVESERLVYEDSFADADGNPLPEMPTMLITVELADEADQTRFTSRTRFASAADLEKTLAMGMVEGFGQTLDRLDEELAAAQSAPRA